MNFNLAQIDEANQAFEYLTELVGKESIVRITKVSPRRSLSQNNYLHLLIGAFGQHFGYTMDEAKLIYKHLNESIYKYSKTVRGKKWDFYKSSAHITKEEMAKTIDTFRAWSDKAGYPLPLATDKDWLRQIENEIERSKYYL